MVGSRNALLQGGVYMCVHYQCIQRPTPICVLAFYMYMIPPHIILAHVLSHVPVFISPALVPKRLVHHTLIDPSHLTHHLSHSPTPSLSMYLPMSNITTLLHTSPLPLPPSPLPCHPTPPPHSTYLLSSHTCQIVPPPGPSPRISVHSLQSLAPARINGTSTPLPEQQLAQLVHKL